MLLPIKGVIQEKMQSQKQFWTEKEVGTWEGGESEKSSFTKKSKVANVNHVVFLVTRPIRNSRGGL